MQKMLVFAVLVATVMATSGLVMIRSTPTGAAPRVTGPSAFEMMARARDLPVAPIPDAF